MCDYKGRLVAWMDGELAENDAAVVEQHVRACAECRDCVAAYEEASRGFAAYYDATLQSATATPARRKLPRWVPVVAGAAAVLAAAVLLVSLLPRFVKPVPAVPQAAVTRPPVASPPVAVEPAAKPVQTVAPVQRRHVAARKKAANTNWAMADPAVQIAIPGEAMFPPGAVPEGVNYIANVSLTDGSVQGIRLQR